MNPSYDRGARESELAVERRQADTDIEGVDYRRERSVYGVWEKIRISSDEGARSIGRPIGSYDTLITGRIEQADGERIADLADEVARELCSLCVRCGVSPDRILVVGVGNPALTPDGVGPRTAELVEATMHLTPAQRQCFDGEECSEIAVIIPSVAAHTGIDSLQVIKGVCNSIEPDLIIAVDSIVSRSPKRLGSSIQLSDTGIRPGGGVGASTGAIDRQSMGAPVIAIGVPTVIDARHLSDKTEGEDLFVCSSNVSPLVEVAARIIAGGINQAFGLASY